MVMRHIRRRLGSLLTLSAALVALTACTVTYLPDAPPRTATVTITPGLYPCADGRVGITVDDRMIVIGLVEGGPAWRAGIRYGDVVVSVDGQRVFTIADAQFLAAGPPGTLVTVTVERTGVGGPLLRNYTMRRACLP